MTENRDSWTTKNQHHHPPITTTRETETRAHAESSISVFSGLTALCSDEEDDEEEDEDEAVSSSAASLLTLAASASAIASSPLALDFEMILTANGQQREIRNEDCANNTQTRPDSTSTRAPTYCTRTRTRPSHSMPPSAHSHTFKPTYPSVRRPSSRARSAGGRRCPAPRTRGARRRPAPSTVRRASC